MFEYGYLAEQVYYVVQIWAISSTENQLCSHITKPGGLPCHNDRPNITNFKL